MERKGFELTIYTLIESVLIFIVLIAFASYINSLKNDTLIEKTAILRDVSMLANTVQASPQDIVVVYKPEYHPLNANTLAVAKYDLSKYHFSFTNSYIQLRQQDFTTLSYPYYNNLFFQLALQDINKQDKIVLSKFSNSFVTASEFIVGYNQPQSQSQLKSQLQNQAVTQTRSTQFVPLTTKLTCPSQKATITLEKITIAPSKRVLQQEFTTQAAAMLQKAIPLAFKKTVVTVAQPGSTDSLLIIIRLYTAAKEENKITAYIREGSNELQNQKLACLLLNSVIENTQVTQLPEIKYLAKTDEDYELLYKNKENLAIVLELGNSNNEDNPLTQEMQNTVNSIVQALQQYDKDR